MSFVRELHSSNFKKAFLVFFYEVRSLGVDDMASILFIAFRRGVLRAVFRGSKSTYEQLLKKANLKSLYERRLQDEACMIFKVRHDLCPPTVKTLFSLKSSTYNLRGADFHIPRFNTVAFVKHSLRYIGALP